MDADSQTFDLRAPDILSEEQAQEILTARKRGAVYLLVEPQSETLRKLGRYGLGRVLEVREGVLCLAA